MIRPVSLPFFFFSWIAAIRDRHIMEMAMVRNSHLWLTIHLPTATLPRPKLARTSEACQQKAKIVAERMAPMLLTNFSIFPIKLH